MEKQLTENLVKCVSAYARACDLSEGRVWRLSVGDDKFPKRVIDGGASFTVASYDRALRWFSDNWPKHLKWPADVERPERSEPEYAA